MMQILLSNFFCTTPSISLIIGSFLTFPLFPRSRPNRPQLAVSEETQQRIKNQSSLFLGKSCNYVTNPLEEVSRTDYAFLPEGERGRVGGAGENEEARSQIMRDTNSLNGLWINVIQQQKKKIVQKL